jgi:hypothetical protein
MESGCGPRAELFGVAFEAWLAVQASLIDRWFSTMIATQSPLLFLTPFDSMETQRPLALEQSRPAMAPWAIRISLGALAQTIVGAWLLTA